MHQNNGIWVSTEDLNKEASFLQSAEQEFSFENIDQTEGKWAASRRDFLKLMGFGLGAATIAASCEIPVKRAIPYVSKPDDIVPGVANYFASSFVNGGDYCAVLVKTREGRPIKIEGNPEHPLSGGGLCAVAHAVVFNLYDSERLRQPLIGAKPATWSEVDSQITSKLEAI